MDLERLKKAQPLLNELLHSHELIKQIVNGQGGAATIECTDEEALEILKKRITKCENELRATGLVAAIPKPEGLRFHNRGAGK